ncbi:MAG: hypothetical protein AAGF60_11200 [Pseudomonadota bacterium]
MMGGSTGNPRFGSHCYSGAAEKIRRAESMMRGARDVMWRKLEEEARRLIWC